MWGFKFSVGIIQKLTECNEFLHLQKSLQIRIVKAATLSSRRYAEINEINVFCRGAFEAECVDGAAGVTDGGDAGNDARLRLGGAGDGPDGSHGRLAPTDRRGKWGAMKENTGVCR